MGATLTTLLSQLRNRLSATADDALLTPAMLTECVNNGVAAFADERAWPWLDTVTTISVVAGTNSHNLPADCTDIHSLSITGEPIVEVQYDEYLDLKHRSGQPTVFVRVGSQLLLAPVPAVNYTADLYYQAEENFLTDDADTIKAPVRYTSLAVTYAAIYAAVSIRDNGNLANLYALQKWELSRAYDAVNASDVGPRIQTRDDMRA